MSESEDSKNYVKEWLEHGKHAINEKVFEIISDTYSAIINNFAPEFYVDAMQRCAKLDFLKPIQHTYAMYGIDLDVIEDAGPKVRSWLNARIPKRWSPMTPETFKVWDCYSVDQLSLDVWPVCYPPCQYIQWLHDQGEYERAEALIDYQFND